MIDTVAQKHASKAEQSDRTHRIKRVSGIMKWVLASLMAIVVVIGLLLLFVLLAPDVAQVSQDVIDFGHSGRTYGEIPAVQRWLMALFYDMSIGTFLITLWYMRSIFSSFHALEFFSTSTLSAMVWCGIWFVIFGIMDILEEPMAAVLTTYDLGPGRREIEFLFEGGEVFFIIFGITFITLGWVMREAASLKEENQQFI